MPNFNENDDRQRSPHPDRFHYLRETLVGDQRLDLLQSNLVAEAMEEGAMASKILFADATVVDLCRDVNGGCKEVATCAFILGTGKPARGCLKKRYPEAEYSYKKKDWPFLGFRRHVLKDWRSGLSICSKTAGAKLAENLMLLEMLEECHDILPNWKYLVADKGYDDGKVYRAISEAGLIPIIAMRKGGVAEYFTINREDLKAKFRVTRSGQPLCNMNYPMQAAGTEDTTTLWTCPENLVQPDDIEDGLCRGYHPDYCDRFEVETLLDPRRLCPLPRSERKWKEIYNMRSHAERVFSWEDHFMDSNSIPFTKLDEIDYYLRMGDITQLVLGRMAQRLDVPPLLKASGLPGLAKKMAQWSLHGWRSIPNWFYTLVYDRVGNIPNVNVIFTETDTDLQINTTIPKAGAPQ